MHGMEKEVVLTRILAIAGTALVWFPILTAGMLVGGQGLAVVTGLASVERAPAGVWWALVVASLVVYTLALVAMGVGGALLLRDLFKGRRSPTESL